MHILCTICSDLLNQAENIHVTKCGHMFHYDCLHRWITRSKTCPQCRNKVTVQGTFRLFPTISNDPTGPDATTLQSRLDDALLNVRELTCKLNEKTKKLEDTDEKLKSFVNELSKTRNELFQKDVIISTLKDKIQYLSEQNRVTDKLKEENDFLNKKLGAMIGLQTVLNCAGNDIDDLLASYSDARTVAMFAAALKRALCDTEKKKNECRDQLHTLKQQLAEEKAYVADLQCKLIAEKEKFDAVKQKYYDVKRKRPRPDPDTSVIEDSRIPEIQPSEDQNDTIDLNPALVDLKNDTDNSDSPYLKLRQSNLALTSLQRHPKHTLPERNLKPSEYAILSSARNATTKSTLSSTSETSIFHKKKPPKIQFSQNNDPILNQANISYDGLGGHSKLDTFPVPNTRQPQWHGCVPKLSAKHKLKRPNPGNQDISKMLEKKNKTAN